MRTGAVLAAAGLSAGLLLAAAPAVAAPAPLFRIADPQITEASGIAAGIRSPGVVYVQNDSGDSARFFALDARTGAALATYDVPGVDAIDWEDIAVAPDADGTPSVWLADTGDNDHTRRTVEIYRVDEPVVDTAARGVAETTAAPQVWRLRYPDGAHDTESLAVSPDGVPYLVTKSIDGRSVVYQAPRQPAAGVETLRQLAVVRFGFTGTPGPFAPFGQVTATGAAYARDGSVFAVRTYTDAYFWPVGAAGLAAALKATPTRLALPRQPQGEGIGLVGDQVLIDSEGTDSAVYRLDLPALPTGSPSSSGAAQSSAQSSAPSSAAPLSSSAPPTPATSPAADTRPVEGWSGATLALAIVAAAGAVLIGGLVLRRRRS